MKLFLLLSVLLLSTGTSKAEEFHRPSYLYGAVYGAGRVLCDAATEGGLEKEYVRDYLANYVEGMKSHPVGKELFNYIDKGYEDVKEADGCKGILK